MSNKLPKYSPLEKREYSTDYSKKISQEEFDTLDPIDDIIDDIILGLPWKRNLRRPD